MDHADLIVSLHQAVDLGEHPADLPSLHEFLGAAARYAWAIQGQAEPDESLSEVGATLGSVVALTKAWFDALAHAMR